MADSHFRCIELHLPFDEFQRIPRNSAYKYEYFDGRAVLSPRPKCYRAVLDLRDEERDVFLLRQNGELTYEQIAEMHGCPVGTVKTRMRAALEKLRKVLCQA